MADAPLDRPALLRKRAHAFCAALLAPPPPAELIAQFFVPPTSPPPSSSSSSSQQQPSILEHGPSWATPRLPFLGKLFAGADGCEQYFAALGATLRMQLPADAFPAAEAFAVDAEAAVDADVAGGGGGGGGGGLRGKVAVVGKGRFASVATGRAWDEEFAYVLSGWDDAGRFARWEVWADPLSAWVAVGEEDVDGWRRGEVRR